MLNRVFLLLIFLFLFGAWNILSANNYAVLIAGQRPENVPPPDSLFQSYVDCHNEVRFMPQVWHDTVLMFNLLRSKGYSQENIYVLYGWGNDYLNPALEGTVYDPDPDNEINLIQITDYECNLSNITQVFEGFSDGSGFPGIPQLQSDDFLFIWTFNHGGYTPNNGGHYFVEISDYQRLYDCTFSLMIDSIVTQKKVIWMQNCRSGGFVPYLEGPDRVIITACDAQNGANDADDRAFEGGAEIEGLENEILAGPIVHGEFNFHMISINNGSSPTNMTSYNGISYTGLIADPDQDGIIDILESYEWENSRESYPNEEPIISDISNVAKYTSLQYPNLINGEINANLQASGVSAINGDLCVSNGASLTILSGSRLYLVNGDIRVINGSSLVIEPNVEIHLLNDNRIFIASDSSIDVNDNVVFIGENHTQFENTPQEIAGNRIIVNGSVSIGEDVFFTSLNDQSWDGLYLYGTGQSELIAVTFEDCNLFCANGSLLVRDSNFDQSSVSCSGSSMDFRNCTITGKMTFNNALEVILDHVTAIGNDNSQPSVKVSNTPSLTLKNNTSISGLGGGLELNSCRDYSITNCNISNNTGNGISIYETNGMYRYLISDCSISDNDGAGIRLYNSIANVTSCSITENDYQGISAFRVNNLTIQKDPNTAAYYRDCYIANNEMQEISFVNSTNLFADRAKNMIVDNSFALGTFDQYLVYCPNMETNRWLRLNFWGYRDNHSVAIMPPENRFYPECTEPMFNEVGYYLSPVWDPGIPRIVDPNNDEIVFQTAIDAALDENASLAITLFKQLISEYPDSKFCSASAKHLFALEDDKQALKDYYQSEPNLHYNGEIDKIIDYLTTHCNIKLGNYQEAIAWFEDVISNPESEIDSLMAVIDLGYVYMLMEGDDKASVICRYPQLKPKTMSEYETNRESILVNLFGTAQNQAGYTNSEYTEQAIMPVLRSNFPNPFNPTTTISFLLPKDATCTLDVYNIRGQKVKNLVNGSKFAGNHSVVWNGLDDNGKPVSSGLYFYRLTTPNSSQTNKMLLLK